MSLHEILARVEGRQKTLSILNPDLSQSARDRIRAFFEPQQVRLRAERTESGIPTNVAVLHDEDEFVAASSLETVYEFIQLEAENELQRREYPDVLKHVDDTTFTEFGKRRMIVASREIESVAHDVGTGTLHSGFQRLSRLRDQWRIYRQLAGTDLEVHVYGVDDLDTTPSAPLLLHGDEEDGELAETWFVVFDGDGEDDRKRALLAEDVGNDRYTGVWTTDASVVDDILAHLRETYPTWDDGTGRFPRTSG